MDLFSFLSFHFMCVTVTVVTGHSVALNRRFHLFSTMSSLHDVLVHDNSISISEVKDMKSDVLWTLHASHSEKTLNLVCRLNFNNFQERKIA
jgi:hypothetical protein